MNPRVEYLTWFKENEKGMNPRNNLASSAIFEPQQAVQDLIRSHQLSDRLDIHDPWWHPALLQGLKRTYGLVEGRELIITNGASGAIWLVCQALISPGDHVIVEWPVYQPLLAVPKFLGAEVSLLERRPESSFAIDKEVIEFMLKQRPDTRLIVLSNLHNPTGYPLGDGVLSWLREVVKRQGRNIHVLIDETFSDLIPGGRDAAANLDECFISINTLSKAYGLSILRCGWIIASGEAYARIRDTYVLVENAGSRVTESLASIAVDSLNDYQQRSWRICAENRKIVYEFLSPLIEEGLISGAIPPSGCLYFPSISGLADTEEFSQWLRDSWNVYVVPGHFFEAPTHIRIGFGGDTKYQPEIFKRLASAIRSRIIPKHE